MDGLFKRLSALYLRALEPALRHRGWVLAGSLAFFLLSLGTIGLLRQEFIPSQDMSRFTIRFQTPVGTSLDATDRYFRQIESFLMARPEVTLFAGSVGGGSDVNSGQAYVNMKEPRERPVDPKLGRRLTQLEFMDVVRTLRRHDPGRARRPAGHLADRLQPVARRRLPDRVQRPRPRLERARRLGARDRRADARSRAWSPTSTPTTRSACPRCRSSPTATGPPTSASAWRRSARR